MRSVDRIAGLARNSVSRVGSFIRELEKLMPLACKYKHWQLSFIFNRSIKSYYYQFSNVNYPSILKFIL